ncbi:hypothetical protein SAI_0021 [Streptococcus agalactiae H36B]|nr:hypothetical protein SAL_0037 [Streptococcus agalactiae 515]EAO78897.1 hypothetical protein SAI_0021 [Streptococcus agalactiae H36B]
MTTLTLATLGAATVLTGATLATGAGVSAATEAGDTVVD